MAEDWEEETSTGFSFSGQVTYRMTARRCKLFRLIMRSREDLAAPARALEVALGQQRPSRLAQVR